MEKLTKYFNIYCEDQIADFKKSDIYKDLYNLVQEKKLSMEVVYEKGIDVKDKHIYLCVSVYDNDGEIIEIYDEGSLTMSTYLIEIDKKGRIKYYDWNDDDFIDTLNWITKEVAKFIDK